jgi:tetratricopeptide (TPR) repeat protein
METQIKYLETIFSFYEDRHDFYFKLSNEIGGYYKGLGNCNKAFKYFQEVLANSTSIERRDFAIAKSADCYRDQELPKALTLLQEAYDSTDYLQSRTVLADIYYEQEKYDEVVKLLDPISASIDPVTLSILGESLYQEGMYTDSIEILKKALASNPLLSDDNHRIHSYLYLGAAYFKINKPFDAAENFFKAFSEQICPYTPVLSTQEEEIYIPRFKSAIDSVSQQNPADSRTNLWNFVYFLYTGEIENASKFFKANLSESPKYEQKFLECVSNMVKSK